MSVVVRMEMPQNCINCDLRYECNAFYAPGKPKPFMKGCRIVCQLPELCYRYAQRILEEAPTVEPASPWHRVEEELPNDGEWAIFTNGKVVTVERFKVDAYNHFFPASQWFDFEDAIAWMPLPEPPKEDA